MLFVGIKVFWHIRFADVIPHSVWQCFRYWTHCVLTSGQVCACALLLFGLWGGNPDHSWNIACQIFSFNILVQSVKNCFLDVPPEMSVVVAKITQTQDCFPTRYAVRHCNMKVVLLKKSEKNFPLSLPFAFWSRVAVEASCCPKISIGEASWVHVGAVFIYLPRPRQIDVIPQRLAEYLR